MKTELSKKEAEEKIHSFFKKPSFSAEEMKKIKRLAMHFKIKLKDYRKIFCKKCLSRLEGKTRVSNNYKTIECRNCGYQNRRRIK